MTTDVARRLLFGIATAPGKFITGMARWLRRHCGNG